MMDILNNFISNTKKMLMQVFIKAIYIIISLYNYFNIYNKFVITEK